MTDTSGMLKAALWYAGNGIPVFPCVPREKRPLTQHGHKEATTNIDKIGSWWKQWPAANIGVPTGDVSGFLVVDIDPRNHGEETWDEIREPYPATAEQITGGGGRHIVFRHPGVQTPKTVGPGIDLKGDGGYIVVAPSVHPSGNRYEWDGADGAKALLCPADAPPWLLERLAGDGGTQRNAANAERPQEGNHQGNRGTWGAGERNNQLTRLAGALRRRELSAKAIEAALLAANADRCNPPLPESEVRAIAGSIGRKPAGRSAARAEASNDWPKPEPIQSDLPPVQAFSEDLLPDSFRPLVADVTERMQVPMDYPAVMMVLCLAGAVNRRALIQPKANDTGWLVVPNLWGGIIAPPGFMKTPVIQAATRPLTQIQANWRREYEDNLAKYARAKEEHELRRAAWKEQYKAASKKGNAAPDRPEDEAQEPTLRRLIVNDATFEALHQTMSENPAGILVIRDELTGWWSQLDKAGREGERAFCLEAWDGNTGRTVDRIGRGTIHVEACCMSMLGGIQPGRLRSYLVDALEDGPSNDGLIQRFQLMVWPDTVPDWRYVDQTPDGESEARAAEVFRRLVEMDAEDAARYRFAADAQELFIDWLAVLEAKIRGDELHSALASHLSKYRKLMPALALLFELAERGTRGDGRETVSVGQARKAAAWCEYLESHARRVYSCIVTPQLRAARELADKIKHRKVGSERFFSCRDVYLKGWSGLDSPEAVKLAAEVLQDAGWVRDVCGESSDPLGRGRPSNRYEVNPGVWE